MSVRQACGLVLWLAVSAHAAPGPAQPVSVMTFNIRFDYPEDAAQGRSWTDRQALVVAAIRDAGPDIFGTQEDKEDQVADLQRELAEYRHCGSGRSERGHGEHTAIWYRTAAFTKAEDGQFWLSDTPERPGSISWGERHPHKITWVVLQRVGKPSAQILVLNAHFDSGNETSRDRSVRVIHEWLARRKPAMPVILLGDFNVAQEDPAYRALTNPATAVPLADAWLRGGGKTKGAGTTHRFEGTTGNKRPDLVLVSDGIRVRGVRRVEYHEHRRYPSDHFPVLAECEILPAAGR